MKKYNVMLYPYRHASKKDAQNYVGAIKNGILNYPKQMTIVKLSQAMTCGYTVILGHAEYSQEEKDTLLLNKKIGAGDKHWVNQQVFAIDFDNDGEKYLSIEDAIKICSSNNLYPAFIYTTDSHTDDRHRFRAVFVMDALIDSDKAHRAVVGSLFNIFTIDNECVVDTKCKDKCRLFYPGKEIVYKNYDAVVDVNLLISNYVEEEVVSKGSSCKNKAVKQVVNQSSEIIKLIKENQVEKVRNILFLKGKNLAAQSQQGLEGDRLYMVQVSYISLFIEDTCTRKSRSATKPVNIRLPEVYYDEIRKIPIDFLLDLPFNTLFSCMLPDHNDSNPSARIELNKEGSYIYHCYGCDSYLDLFDVLERVTGLSHYQVKTFINKLFNIKFETEWQIEKKRDILEYQDYIWSKQFEKDYPLLYSKLSRSNSLGVLNLVLQIARMYLYDCNITGSDKYLFYMSMSLMSSKAKDFIGTNMIKSLIQKKIKYLTNLGLIEVVKEEDLPAKFKRELMARRIASEQRYRINCFCIPMFTMELLHDAEKQIEHMDANSIRRNYYCREAELRANGIEAANNQFVQDHNKGISAVIEEFYLKYKAVAIKLIAKKGWTTEKEILTKIKKYSERKKLEYSGICLPQLLRESELKRIRYSKEHENKFAIKKGALTYGISKIIIQE